MSAVLLVLAATPGIEMARSSAPNVERPTSNAATKNHPVNLFIISPLFDYIRNVCARACSCCFNTSRLRKFMTGCITISRRKGAARN
jgi:hypothetical protein